MASGTPCTTVVMECRCATPALRRRGSASGSCRSVISSRAWDAEGLENQSLALNSTILAEPAAREAFRRGAARYERLPHALDAPRGASRTGRVARAEMRSAEETSRARLWSSKAPQRDGRLQQTITPESRHQSRHQPARLGWWWQDSSTPAAHIMMDKVTSAYRGMSANHRSGDSASSCRTTEPSSYTSGTSSVCSCGFL